MNHTVPDKWYDTDLYLEDYRQRIDAMTREERHKLYCGTFTIKEQDDEITKENLARSNHRYRKTGGS